MRALLPTLPKDVNNLISENSIPFVSGSPVSFQTTPADPIIKRIETVGKVQPHVKAKLIDPEGHVVPVGTPGEICVAGYLLQKGCVSLYLA